MDLVLSPYGTPLIKVGQDGRQTGHNSILIQWQNGKKEIVFPAHMKTAPAKF